MAQTYYQELWKKTQNELKKNLEFDAVVKAGEPYQDLEKAKWLVGHLYMNYICIVKKLDECYDQMIHPQKREVIGRLLDMSLGRLLELKNDIVQIECDNYCFFDNILIELKMTHEDMEIKVPKYFLRDRENANKHRRELIKQVFEEAEKQKFKEEFLKNIPPAEKEKAWEKYKIQEEKQKMDREKFELQQMKVLESSGRLNNTQNNKKMKAKAKSKEIIAEAVTQAIILIQRHERARQGRIAALLAQQRRKLKQWGELSEKVSEVVRNSAAKVIQSHWRRYRKKKREAKVKQQLMEFLGAYEPSYRDMTEKKKLEKNINLRINMQRANQKEYEDALATVKEKVTALYSIQMEEDIVDEIRAWFQWFFDKTNFLPDYPPEKPILPTGEIFGIPKKLGEAFGNSMFPQTKNSQKKNAKMTALAISLAGMTQIGGSALVTAGHWISPQEFLIYQKELEKMKQGGKSEKNKKKSEKEKADLKKKEEEQNENQREKSSVFRTKSSNFVDSLIKANRDYNVIWADLDESKNYEQRYIYDFVKDEKCWELSMEVRKMVDEMMALELEVLKDALARDKNPKKKKKKKKKPKKKKEKKKKKGKNAKKDLTGNRTLDDLFMELFRNGIIREFEEAYLTDYMGERSFSAFDMRQRLTDWPPSTGDVRELILQLCILPLGSSRVHQLSPLIKSICLMGTENSGKEFLARIVMTETASVMFDLTPANVAGKYPGKDGLKMLQHLIEKMSRALQPSIIFVDGAEKPFYKKVPKEDKDIDPRRIGKLIQKVVKGIKPPDQVLLLGVCSYPWLSRRKKFLKIFQNIIFIPQMDYGSYVRLWQSLLSSYHSMPRDFDVSCLARLSHGYSVKAIMDAIRNVLTIQRISMSPYQPYQPMEFLEELLKSKPIDEKMKTKCLNFYATTSLPKKRAKLLPEKKEGQEKVKRSK